MSDPILIAESCGAEQELWCELLKLNALRPPCPTCDGTHEDRRTFYGFPRELRARNAPGEFEIQGELTNRWFDLFDRRWDHCSTRVTCRPTKPPPCPDCVDGKVSIEQLAATWRAVHDDTITKIYGNCVWLPMQANSTDATGYRDHLRAVKP